jgi:hypothetical protein
MMHNGLQQTHIVVSLSFESPVCIFHERITERDLIGGPTEDIHRINNNISMPMITMIMQGGCAPVLFQWDALLKTQWSPTVHRLLPYVDRIAIRTLYLIRVLRAHESPVGQLDKNMFRRVATFVMGDYLSPLMIYPTRDILIAQFEQARLEASEH